MVGDALILPKWVGVDNLNCDLKALTLVDFQALRIQPNPQSPLDNHVSHIFRSAFNWFDLGLLNVSPFL